MATPPPPETLSDEALEEAISEVAGCLHALTYRLLCLLGELERRGVWAEQGFVSCAAWLSWRVGIAPGAAREKLRVARALEGLPGIAAALACGELSYSKALARRELGWRWTEEGMVHLEAWLPAEERAWLVGVLEAVRGQVEEEILGTDKRQAGGLRAAAGRRLRGDAGAVRSRAGAGPGRLGCGAR